MDKNDDFGDRMKNYESVETDRKLNPMLPIYARIDGRAFSKFTKNMEKPFDTRMVNAMVETTKYLVKETNAKIGYTQSDEISLIWLVDNPLSDVLFSGKIQKMCSVISSMAAVKFATVIPIEFISRLPHFDCRIFQLPSKEEAANAILWRAMDAKKNAISMVAQSCFSHKQLQNKSQKDMLSMLKDIDVHFENDYKDCYKKGTFVRKVNVQKKLTQKELLKLPINKQFETIVTRTEIKELDVPYFNKVVNRVGFIFNNELPFVKGDI